MDAKEFDALVERLQSGTSRRAAMRGFVAGALTSAAVARLAGEVSGKGKGKKSRKGASAETNAVGKGKRIMCFCPDSNPANCSTVRLKTKKAKKRLKKFPNSYRGKCDAVTTTTSTTSTTSTTTSTTSTTTSTTSTSTTSRTTPSNS